MASKKRGGLSRREIAAKAAGKKLAPKKLVPRAKASSSGAIGQNADGSYIYPKGKNYTPTGPEGPGLGYHGDYVQTDDRGNFTGISSTPQKKSKKSSSSKNYTPVPKNYTPVNAIGQNRDGSYITPKAEPKITNRAQAAKQYGGQSPWMGFGANPADEYASPNLSGAWESMKSLFGDFTDAQGKAQGNMSLAAAPTAYLTGEERQANLNNALGVQTAEASMIDQPPITDETQPYIPDYQARDEQAAADRAQAEAQARVQDETDRQSGALQSGMGTPQMDQRRALKEATAGFGSQEKRTERMFKDLINALDPQYAEYQRVGQDTLEKSKQDDLAKLASLFAAYGTADSEQRMQQQERVQGDYATQLRELLAKLMLQKQGDTMDYQTKRYNALNEIDTARSNAKQTTLKMLQDAEDRAWDRNYKNRALASRGGKTTNAIGTMTPIQWNDFGNPVAWVDHRTGSIMSFGEDEQGAIGQNSDGGYIY